MRYTAFLGAILAITLSPVVACQDVNRTSTGHDKLAIKVLFAGDPGTARTRDFLTFLRQHFTQVRFAEIEKHTHDASTGHDVIILDSANRTKVPGLSRDDGRPTILIGTFGGYLGSRWRLRTNWC